MALDEAEVAKDVLALAAAKAEEVVQAAVIKAEAVLMRHADERIEATAERAAEKAIEKIFIRLGVDVSDPIEMQKDFAHVRAFRQSVESVKSKGLATIVTVAVTGMLGAAYMAMTGKVY